MTNIKPLTIEHLPIYADVIRESFSTAAADYGLTIENFPHHWSFATNERLEKMIMDGYYPYGYFAGEKLVGFVTLKDMGDNSYDMRILAVLPDYRHLGYGKALLDFCKEKVIAFGGGKININTADSDIRLKKWYEDNGFIHIKTEIYEHVPLPVGYMEWRS